MAAKSSIAREFDNQIQQLRLSGMKRKDIAKILGLSTSQVFDRIAALRIGRRIIALEGKRKEATGPKRERRCLSCREMHSMETVHFICDNCKSDQSKIDTAVWDENQRGYRQRIIPALQELGQ